MRRYHRLDRARVQTNDQRQFQPAPELDTKQAQALIQALLAKQERQERGTDAAWLCKKCGAIYRHDVVDLTHCLCCGAVLQVLPPIRHGH